VPNLELSRLLGCEIAAGAVVVDASQRTSVVGVFAAGELVGIGGVSQALATGAIAGLARRRGGRCRSPGAAGEVVSPKASPGLRPERSPGPRPPETVVVGEDVPLGRLAATRSAREAKLHARAGMGACQGRVCQAALAVLRGFEPDSARPPLVPVPISVLAGEDALTPPAAGARGPAPRSA
jgi:hypothetical protein